MQLSVGPPLAGVPFFDGTIRRGDKRQPYTNFLWLRCTKWFDCIDTA